MSDFLAMGGHGFYVWTAYGLTAVGLVGIAAWPLVAMRHRVRTLQQRRTLEGPRPNVGAES